MEHKIGNDEGFKNFFKGIIHKSKGGSQNSFMGLLKRLGQKYKNTNTPIKIVDVDKAEGSFILEDYSKWQFEITIKPPSFNWSQGDEVIVTGSRGGSDRMEIYNIRNTSLNDESLCIFKGFMEKD